MQTFLPLPNFEESAACLDRARLGKQRVEARQLVNAILTRGAWCKHPAAKMWEDYVPALMHYSNVVIREWVARGYANTMQIIEPSKEIIYPWWFGDEAFHASHRSNLLRKNPMWYRQFGWTEPDDLPYLWPWRKKT